MKVKDLIWRIVIILFLFGWIATETWYDYSLRRDVRELKEKSVILQKE